MKNIRFTPSLLLLICLTMVAGCGNSNKSKDTIEEPVEAPVQERQEDSQGENHTYDITINPGSANERHLKGDIINVSKDDGSMNNFSAYSNTENGKGIVLRIGNDELLINGLFFQNADGSVADLFDGSEDDSEERSNLIISIAPPSSDVQNSMSGEVKLSNTTYGVKSHEGGSLGYTLDFDGQFEDYEENISQIKGRLVIKVPNYL
ncbi:hypothetical protein [Gelidibacter pelagius]|uniref:Uncharacterized protein n=1 Tax=Gelidibacter pelagius TaxID=2819985 RepID=A0ABS3SVD7_9FLAO|nr:hypothetical protein [Gelidibacter pelagius]MBO3099675.1 hypothetical protein [Gelidibacter pelagius]